MDTAAKTNRATPTGAERRTPPERDLTRPWAGAAPADAYQRHLVPLLFEPWGRDLVALGAPQPGERVLDLACGTGIVARLAAERVSPSGAVTGVDVNPDMLDVARRADPRIAWVLAGAEATDLPEGAFDVGFCQQGLQFVPDRPAAVRELHRVIAPAGRIAVSTWCDPSSPGYAPFWPVFRRLLPDAVGFLDAIFGLGDGGELHQLLSGAGFRDVRVERRTRIVRCASARAWVGAFVNSAPLPGIAALAPATRDRLVSDVASAFHEDGNGFSFPISADVGYAER
jgi:ubiquinone/menaquinone biosynthesis C-methylase UbiE